MADFSNDVEQALEVLKQGGVILYPTDTVWGLGCDACNEQAVEKIIALKQRPAEKSMIVLLAEERDLLRYITQPDPQVFDFLKSVERPTTVIYRGAIGMATHVIAPDGTAAIRIVQDTFCRHLIKRLRKPLVSTSANLSGEPAPQLFKEISPVIHKGVDYIVRYRQDDQAAAAPSALVRWKEDGTPHYIRN